MSLAFLLSQKATPMKLWSPPKDDFVKRPSDVLRKVNHGKRIEQAYEALTKPMQPCEVAKACGFTTEACYKYLLTLYRAKRIHRSSKQPYVYWKL